MILKYDILVYASRTLKQLLLIYIFQYFILPINILQYFRSLYHFIWVFCDKVDCINFRYVREWLNLMTVGDILKVDPTGHEYFLPHHRRPVLAGQSSSSVAGYMCRSLPMFAHPYDTLLKAFKEDGPLGTCFYINTAVY